VSSVWPAADWHEREVFDLFGIRFNDRRRYDVEEYCISEGWIKVPAGKTVDRRGRPLLLKLKGKVEAFYP
jgi:NADH:ubiquinone oxidoreductase subunit C